MPRDINSDVREDFLESDVDNGDYPTSRRGGKHNRRRRHAGKFSALPIKESSDDLEVQNRVEGLKQAHHNPDDVTRWLFHFTLQSQCFSKVLLL